MVNNEIIALQDENEELKRIVTSLSSKYSSLEARLSERTNFQLNFPLDANSRGIINETVKDIRNTNRVTVFTSESTIIPNAETMDCILVTSQAAALTIGQPIGTATNGQTLVIRIKDNGTARALTWNSIYRASTSPTLPTTTTISKTLYVGFMYNEEAVKWDLLAYIDNLDRKSVV